MGNIEVFTVTYLAEPDAGELTVEMFDIEDDAIVRRDEVTAEGIYVVVQCHGLAVRR
jgi:hypothetical protein